MTRRGGGGEGGRKGGDGRGGVAWKREREGERERAESRLRTPPRVTGADRHSHSHDIVTQSVSLLEINLTIALLVNHVTRRRTLQSRPIFIYCTREPHVD